MPEFIVVAGPPNSGKHPLACDLAAKRGLIVVSRDYLRTATGLRDEGLMTLSMADLASGLLKRGQGVVVCAWNMESSDRRLWGDIAAEAGVKMQWLDTREPDVQAMVPPIAA